MRLEAHAYYYCSCRHAVTAAASQFLLWAATATVAWSVLNVRCNETITMRCERTEHSSLMQTIRVIAPISQLSQDLELIVPYDTFRW